MRKILLAEDDLDFGTILSQYLKLSGFEVCWCKNGLEALSVFNEQNFDLCILDIMMPKLDGISLATEILLKKPKQAFLFLTAKSLKEDRLAGLKLGADDYICKPCEPDELVLKINNILKRVGDLVDLKNFVKIGKYNLDVENCTLIFGDDKVRLTQKEVLLIQYLNQNKNQLIKRDVILKALWQNDDYFNGRSMDVFFSRIRKYFVSDSKIKLISYRNLGIEFVLEE